MASRKAGHEVLTGAHADGVLSRGTSRKSVVQGYFNYHAVPGNLASLWSFRFELRKRWLHVIRRRSQRSRMTWELREAFATQWLPVPKILHPYPLVRFDARHLR